MSKSLISDQLWAEMSEGQKVDAVFRGQATLKQMSEGLLDGSDQLRNACRESLAGTGPAFENLPVDAEQDHTILATTAGNVSKLPSRRAVTTQTGSNSTHKQRFGLPAGFVSRPARDEQNVLLERNVYRLPDGQEFITCRPTGTLGASRHRYALLTNEQYLKGRRGSVYVRTDGRIFNYSIDTAIPLGDMFDTGYTIADLERTGKYAPEYKARKQRDKAKIKRVSAGS